MLINKNMPQEKAVLVQSWIANNNFDMEPDDRSLASVGNQCNPPDNASPVEDANYDFKDERRLSGNLSEEGRSFFLFSIIYEKVSKRRTKCTF